MVVGRRTGFIGRGIWHATVLPALLLSAGCAEEPFEPIQQSDMEFSIYGYLNASGDTQWIRVTGLKTNVLPDSNVIDASVTLEHLGTGEVIPLRDSLFGFGTSLYAWNHWTIEPMEQGATYRITADRVDGGTSSAEATVPVDADTIMIRIHADGRLFKDAAEFRTAGAEYIAMVHVIPGCTAPGFAYQFGGPTVRADEHGVITRPIRRPLYCGPPPYPLYSWDIWIVFSGSPWPYDPEWSRITAFLPEVASNIDGGLGFFGGVLTRTIPFETCHIIGSSPGDICELVYTDRTTAVEGVVRRQVEVQDSCVSVPLRDRAVYIWEDDRPDDVGPVLVEDVFGERVVLHEPDGVTVRSAYSKHDGSFKISALEPGIPYSLAVSYGNEPDYFRPESFALREGETLNLDVELPGECS